MAVIVSIARRGIRVSGRFERQLVDIEIDGSRTWTLELTESPRWGRKVIPWPPELSRRLAGSSECRVVLPGTGRELWRGEVNWSGSESHPELTDRLGRRLAVNKWGQLKPTFAHMDDPHFRERVVESTQNIIALLEKHEFAPFIVGGTLLGAVRNGELLPHDDDADIAYLSEYNHPSDLILENDRVRDLVEAAGYVVQRHSWAHLQVLMTREGQTEYYVDIFTAFYKDEQFHEPIHVRASGMEDAILPLTKIELHGQSLPSPRDAVAWLEACYGSNWRVPDPIFQFETPLGTRRRFDAWFGSYNLGRSFWQNHYLGGGAGNGSTFIHSHIIAAANDGLTRAVIDLGAGTGGDARKYRQTGLDCFTVDAATSAASTQGEFGESLNLVEPLVGVRYLAARLRAFGGGDRIVLSANHLLACQDSRGRRTLLELFHYVLRQGARVITADFEQLGKYQYEDPSTWHLDPIVRESEAKRAGLTVAMIERGRQRDADGMNRSVVVTEYSLQMHEKE